jgi:hypothetical protein
MSDSGPPSQGWRTFLQNHSKELISLDFLTVPTIRSIDYRLQVVAQLVPELRKHLYLLE